MYEDLHSTPSAHKKRTAVEDGEDGGPSKSGLYRDGC
jgi:hypothetical protein